MLRKLVQFTVIILSLLVLLAGCESFPNAGNTKKPSSDPVSEHFSVPTFIPTTKQYYTMDDFDSIVVGESTLADVIALYPPEESSTTIPTAVGTFSDYPMQGGGYIRIKFYGKDLIVFSIEKIEG